MINDYIDGLLFDILVLIICYVINSNFKNNFYLFNNYWFDNYWFNSYFFKTISTDYINLLIIINYLINVKNIIVLYLFLEIICFFDIINLLIYLFT
jgi:hypothetical protein